MTVIDNLEIKTQKRTHSKNAVANTNFKFVDNNFETVATASIWTENMPQYGGYNLAFVGNYSAKTQAHGFEILNEVEEYARSLGHDYLIGPVDGNTWSKYRLVTEGFDSVPFALENLTEKDYPGHFLKAGFDSIAQYQSCLVNTTDNFSTNHEPLEKQVKKAGLTVRSFNPQDSINDLDSLFTVSQIAFRRNFLYTPIDKAQFLAMYEPVLGIIDPDLILIAEDSDKNPVGFVFALPNKSLASGREDTVVLKTLARIPDARYKGVGLYLVSLCHKKAYQKGYGKMIHALYKSDNKSSCFSQLEGAKTIRKYELYGKEIA